MMHKDPFYACVIFLHKILSKVLNRYMLESAQFAKIFHLKCNTVEKLI